MSTPNKVEVSQVNEVTTVEIITAGPQGPSGSGSSGLQVDETNKVDGSVVYYDASSATFKADSTTTKLTLVFGGSF
tara:strand:+ start:4912 stop:5139 length:228 start_codon:yes stop_codon:yes gene_type:complete